MKVFFIGTSPLNNMGGDIMEAHIVSGLNALDVETSYYPFVSAGLGPRLNKALEIIRTDLHLIRSTPVERSLIKSIRQFQPDLVLLLLGNYVPPATVRKIREHTKAPIVCWCQDHMGTMGRQYILGSKFDYLFAKDKTMVDLFRNYTSIPEIHYLPEACNPEVHHPVIPSKAELKRFECDVTTAATLYYYRSEILESLSDMDLKIWGAVPRFYDGPLRKFSTGESVFTHDKAACFNSAKIVVNTLFPMEFGGLNARAFELAGCGGFQLISHSDAVARHFEPGKEIETFGSLGELRDKVCYYLEHDDERRAIADAGRRRAHKEHTYKQRLREMLDIVKL